MLIDVKENDTGFLLPINFKNLPYNPKRVFIIKNKYCGAIRGKHAHREDEQILLVLNGSIKINYENALKKDILELNFGQSYVSKKLEWLEIEMVEENTIVLVICSTEYDENEYIRNYQEFKRLIKNDLHT